MIEIEDPDHFDQLEPLVTLYNPYHDTLTIEGERLLQRGAQADQVNGDGLPCPAPVDAGVLDGVRVDRGLGGLPEGEELAVPGPAGARGGWRAPSRWFLWHARGRGVEARARRPTPRNARASRREPPAFEEWRGGVGFSLLLARRVTRPVLTIVRAARRRSERAAWLIV